MSELTVGNKAPEFSLKNSDGAVVSLGDFAGKWVVVYFYPKDDTPGCTIEANDFTTLLPEFGDAAVVGVSPDDEQSHCKFRDKFSLKHTLLCDPEKTMLEAYGVWRLKKNYGREYVGVVRTTVLIDPQGNVAYVWNNVNAKGHAQKVLDKLSELR